MKIGDTVLLSVGSWYGGRYVADDREVEGTVFGLSMAPHLRTVIRLRVEELQRANGTMRPGIVERFMDEVKTTEKEG